MSGPVEYEFILPDGTTRYEFCYSRAEFWTFYRGYKAIAAKPVGLDKQ